MHQVVQELQALSSEAVAQEIGGSDIDTGSKSYMAGTSFEHKLAPQYPHTSEMSHINKVVEVGLNLPIG